MTEQKATNVHWHEGEIQREHRHQLLGQQGRHIGLPEADNVGQERAGVLIEGVESTAEVLDWADVVLVTGTTLANGTLDGLLTAKPSVLYGVTISGAAALLEYERYCPCGT